MDQGLQLSLNDRGITKVSPFTAIDQ
jgi:hypothetical protein